MKLNDPFSWHGIDHISANQINTLIHSQALWLARVAGYKATVGASAFRGTAIGVAAQILGTTGDKEVATLAAEKTYKAELKKFGIAPDDSAAVKEHKIVTSTTEMLCGSWADKVLEAERKIELRLDDIPVPIIGYVDMVCEDKIIELKSKAVTTNKIDAAANMQAAIYQEATGLPAEVCITQAQKASRFLRLSMRQASTV